MPSENSFLSPAELKQVGFAALGENVLISRHARFYAPERISLGNHVRIDDFCVLSAGDGAIKIGSYFHLSCACLLYGAGGITIGDFSAISSRCAVYSLSDDFSGETPANPMLPATVRRNVTLAPVVLGDHVMVGTASTLLPGVTLATGCAVGAHSMVVLPCQEWTIYSGNPARPRGPRSKNLLQEIKKIGPPTGSHDPIIEP